MNDRLEMSKMWIILINLIFKKDSIETERRETL